MSDDDSVTTFEVSSQPTTRLTALIRTVEPDDGASTEWTIHEKLTATREGFYSLDGNKGDDYWLISGDSTGSQSLIVWDYHLDAMIALLQACKATPRSGVSDADR